MRIKRTGGGWGYKEKTRIVIKVGFDKERSGGDAHAKAEKGHAAMPMLKL